MRAAPRTAPSHGGWEELGWTPKYRKSQKQTLQTHLDWDPDFPPPPDPRGDLSGLGRIGMPWDGFGGAPSPFRALLQPSPLLQLSKLGAAAAPAPPHPIPTLLLNSSLSGSHPSQFLSTQNIPEACDGFGGCWEMFDSTKQLQDFGFSLPGHHSQALLVSQFQTGPSPSSTAARNLGSFASNKWDCRSIPSSPLPSSRIFGLSLIITPRQTPSAFPGE